MIFHINFEYAILVILMAFGISVIPGNPFFAFNLSSKEPLGTCLPDEIILSYSSFGIHLPTLVDPPLRLPFSAPAALSIPQNVRSDKEYLDATEEETELCRRFENLILA